MVMTVVIAFALSFALIVAADAHRGDSGETVIEFYEAATPMSLKECKDSFTHQGEVAKISGADPEKSEVLIDNKKLFIGRWYFNSDEVDYGGYMQMVCYANTLTMKFFANVPVEIKL